MPEHTERHEAGKRLKAALDRLYPRSRGGLRKLADDAKIGPETLYRWFRGDSEPDLGTLRRVADACGVSRTELVAAMDADAAPSGWDLQLTQDGQPVALVEVKDQLGEVMKRQEVLELVDGVRGEVIGKIDEATTAVLATLAHDVAAQVTSELRERLQQLLGEHAPTEGGSAE